MNTVDQENGRDCSVFVCVHDPVCNAKGAVTGVLPKIAKQQSEDWRALLHSCLLSNFLTPLETAFLADLSLQQFIF